MSRPSWTGTVVARPSGCRIWWCDPRCRAVSNPSARSSLRTSVAERTGTVPTSSCDSDELRSDELPFEGGLAVFEEELDHFPHVRLELVQALGLRVRAGKAGDGPDQERGLWVALDDDGEHSHGSQGLKRLGSNSSHGQKVRPDNRQLLSPSQLR